MTYSRDEALTQALLCDKAYKTYKIGDVVYLDHIGLREKKAYKVIDEISIITLTLTAVRGYILLRETPTTNEYSVIFRGTADIFQGITDVMLISTNSIIVYNKLMFPINTYFGFHSSMMMKLTTVGTRPVDYILDKLSTIISKDISGKHKTLNFCGHSLGAAQSTLLCMYYFTDINQEKYNVINKNKFKKITLNTYAEPKMTKDVGMKCLFSYLTKMNSNFEYNSIMNDQDIISHITTMIMPSYHSNTHIYKYDTLSNKLAKINTNVLSVGIWYNTAYSILKNLPILCLYGLFNWGLWVLLLDLLFDTFIITIYYHSVDRYIHNICGAIL
jgi:hypothetical protein